MSELQHWIYHNSGFVNKSLLTIKKTDNCFVKDLYGSQGILRNYINTNEYLIYYTLQKDSGRGTVMYDYNKFSEIKNYFKDEKEKIEKTGIKMKDKNRIIKELKLGEIDILIGTHKLVSKDIAYEVAHENALINPQCVMEVGDNWRKFHFTEFARNYVSAMDLQFVKTAQEIKLERGEAL